MNFYFFLFFLFFYRLGKSNAKQRQRQSKVAGELKQIKNKTFLSVTSLVLIPS